jgi:hypothetical protein
MKKIESLGKILTKKEQKVIVGGTIPQCTPSTSTPYVCRNVVEDPFGPPGSYLSVWCDVVCFATGEEIPSNCWLYNQVPFGACP